MLAWSAAVVPLGGVACSGLVASVMAGCGDDVGEGASTAAGAGAAGSASGGAPGAGGTAGAPGAGGTAGAPGAGGAGGEAGAFVFESSAFAEGGTLPADHTCDGTGTSPPLAWSGVPAGTAEMALMMTTMAPDGEKWNWVVYGLAPEATSLAVGEMAEGKAGKTSDGPALAYAPPCSKGPGPKTYVFTLYALSSPVVVDVAADQVTGAYLTAAVADKTLATRTLTVTYTRP